MGCMRRLEDALALLQGGSSASCLDGLEAVREYVISSNGLPRGAFHLRV